MLERDFDQAAADMAQVAHEISRRDRIDSTRAASPLAVADDAVQVDTTGMDAAQVVAQVMKLVEERMGRADS